MKYLKERTCVSTYETYSFVNDCEDGLAHESKLIHRVNRDVKCVVKWIGFGFIVLCLAGIAPLGRADWSTATTDNVLSEFAESRWGPATTLPPLNKDVKQLLEKAELIASKSVILAANSHSPKPISPSVLDRLAGRIDDFDPSCRHQVEQQIIQLLEQDIRRALANERTETGASLAQLQSALMYARHPHYTEYKFDSAGYVGEAKAIENISLYDAAMIISKQGIDPFSREARPYYCQLGFHGLDIAGRKYVSFCSR